jgi:hypothetical protein
VFLFGIRGVSSFGCFVILGLDIFIFLVHPMVFATVQDSILVGLATFLDKIWSIDVTKQVFRLNPFPPYLKRNNTHNATIFHGLGSNVVSLN